MVLLTIVLMLPYIKSLYLFLLHIFYFRIPLEQCSPLQYSEGFLLVKVWLYPATSHFSSLTHGLIEYKETYKEYANWNKVLGKDSQVDEPSLFSSVGFCISTYTYLYVCIPFSCCMFWLFTLYPDCIRVEKRTATVAWRTYCNYGKTMANSGTIL